jgi:hypothetical protein
MLKHGAVTQSRVADAETQRKPPGPTMLKHKESVIVSGQQAITVAPTKECRHSQSAIHVAETTCELRC